MEGTIQFEQKTNSGCGLYKVYRMPVNPELTSCTLVPRRIQTARIRRFFRELSVFLLHRIFADESKGYIS